MGRGILTDEIKTIALDLLGIDINQTELRLMPYVQSVMMNNQKIEPCKISKEDRIALKEWRDKGWIEGGASGLSITKEFWNAINEILWLAYVDYE